MKRVLVVLVIVSVCAAFSAKAYAQDGTMRSNQYRVKTGNINFGSGTPSSASFKLGTTMGQIAAQEFSSTGYTVKAGFQYVSSIVPFTFSISDTSIALGTLSPQTPATATTDLTVSFGGAGQYQVTAVEVGPLATQNGGDTIPDTACNGGGDTCTETVADIWTSTSAYGFGYNMSGTGEPADFVDATYFRPFPDADAAESPAVVMSSNNVTTTAGETATVTFKANISAVQAAGVYDTVVKFVATPTY
jgi:hypothetical protein